MSIKNRRKRVKFCQRKVLYPHTAVSISSFPQITTDKIVYRCPPAVTPAPEKTQLLNEPVRHTRWFYFLDTLSNDDLIFYK